MAKKGGTGSGTTDYDQGTEAWNVADGYTKLKILRQLIMLDRWDTIAQFGTEEIDEDINYTDEQLKRRRVEALQRFHSTIKQLLGNVRFALRKGDRPKIDQLMIRIRVIEEFVYKSYNIKQDEVSHTDIFEIKEVLFGKILAKLEDIKDELNTPLNNAGLIFRPSEEVNIDKIMNDIVEGG